MKYFYIDGTYIPKHCIYGPRQREGVLLDDWEWYRINENLFRWQRERAIGEAYEAKERSKREQSYNITKNWQNTLASIKTQCDQRRLEKREKIEQDKVDKYNQVLESKKEEKKPILDRAKRTLFEGKDATRRVTLALESCAVITERQKQIEFKRRLKEEQAKEDEVFVDKAKKEVEDYKRELEEEEGRRKAVKKAYKELLAEQVEERRKRAEETEERNRRAEEKDVAKMAEALENLRKCEEKEQKDEKRRMKLSCEKGYFLAQREKTLALEEEEENEINRMINDYARRFKSKAAAKEAGLIAETIAKREKMTAALANEIMERNRRENELYEKRFREQEEELMKKEREREEVKQKPLEDLAAWKVEHKAKSLKGEMERKEAVKWAILQNERRRELDQAWVERRRRFDREMKTRTSEAYDMQMKEKAELEEERRKYDAMFVDDGKEDNAELLKYCDEALEYVRERGWNDYPILDIIAKLKKELGLPTAEKEKAEVTKHGGRKCEKPTGLFCYCFKN